MTDTDWNTQEIVAAGVMSALREHSTGGELVDGVTAHVERLATEGVSDDDLLDAATDEAKRRLDALPWPRTIYVHIGDGAPPGWPRSSLPDNEPEFRPVSE